MFFYSNFFQCGSPWKSLGFYLDERREQQEKVLGQNFPSALVLLRLCFRRKVSFLFVIGFISSELLSLLSVSSSRVILISWEL